MGQLHVQQWHLVSPWLVGCTVLGSCEAPVSASVATAFMYLSCQLWDDFGQMLTGTNCFGLFVYLLL